MKQLQDTSESQHEATFDDLMSSLFILVTHYGINQSEAMLEVIVNRLDTLCHHSESELYPNQLIVFTKMRRLWQTKLFQTEVSDAVH